MSGFVATAPAQPVDDPADAIVNDGWFPDLSMGASRNAMRLDGTVTAERLRPALVAAMLDINRQLRAFKAGLAATGVTSLAGAAPDDTIDGQPRLVQLYLRAVMCAAKADLIERYRDFDASGALPARAQDNLPAIDEQRRNAQWAVAEILDRPHTVVALI